jgi:putative copper export protein
MYTGILYIHLLAATIWVGGHLVLTLSLLPKALARRNPEFVLNFEQMYERVGLPAMGVQVISGLWLAHRLLPDVSAWLDWSDSLALTISLKLACLLATIALALHVRLRIIPSLTPAKLPVLAAHIIAVTVIAMIFVWLGVSFRQGGV